MLVEVVCSLNILVRKRKLVIKNSWLHRSPFGCICIPLNFFNCKPPPPEVKIFCVYVYFLTAFYSEWSR